MSNVDRVIENTKENVTKEVVRIEPIEFFTAVEIYSAMDNKYRNFAQDVLLSALGMAVLVGVEFIIHEGLDRAVVSSVSEKRLALASILISVTAALAALIAVVHALIRLRSTQMTSKILDLQRNEVVFFERLKRDIRALLSETAKNVR